METYDVILIARSEKRIPIDADNPDAAMDLALALAEFGCVEFVNEEVVDVSARMDD